MVHKDGFRAFNDLNEEAKRFIAPLPMEYDAKLPGGLIRYSTIATVERILGWAMVPAFLSYF